MLSPKTINIPRPGPTRSRTAHPSNQYGQYSISLGISFGTAQYIRTPVKCCVTKRVFGGFVEDTISVLSVYHVFVGGGRSKCSFASCSILVLCCVELHLDTLMRHINIYIYIYICNTCNYINLYTFSKNETARA